jgi:hypothetical protein
MAKVATEIEVNSWLSSLEEAGKRGRFLGSLTFFYAEGVKPAKGWRTVGIPQSKA